MGEGAGSRGWRLEWLVPGLYAAVAGAWIYGSDHVVAALAGSMERARALSTFKGFGFVVVTAALLHLGLRWALRRERAQADQLRRSEALLRAITDAIPDPVFLKGLDGRWRFANPATLLVIGKSREEVIGRTDAEIYSDPAVGVALMETDRRIMQSGRGEVVEERIQGPSGYRIFQSSKAPYLDPEGRVTGLIGCAQDITLRKQAEREKADMQVQLHHAQRMETMGSLAGGVAHDMNNVLGAILGLASASLPGLPEGSGARQAFETIIRAAERGGKMVHGLLSLARQHPAERRALDVNALLREEVQLLERTTLARVSLEIDLARDLRTIHGDASALSHAIMNLCLNAVDAMEERGTLRLSTRNVADDCIEITVEDNGCGMPEEVRARALDPFFTTKEQGKGTGLGLSIVYTTVKAHGGQLDLQSVPGQGTRITLRLPAVAAAAAPPGTSPGTPQISPGKVLDVLLVDDDELIQISSRALLEALGHRVRTVGSGEAALALCQAGHRPSVVILDLNMPGLGGAETLKRLRGLGLETPILLATGRADQEAIQLAGSLPGVTLLPKPFALKDLQSHLESGLQPGAGADSPAAGR